MPYSRVITKSNCYGSCLSGSATKQRGLNWGIVLSVLLACFTPVLFAGEVSAKQNQAAADHTHAMLMNGADLHVSSLDGVPPAVIVGSSYTLTWEVSNTGLGVTDDGAGGVVSTWTDRVVASGDNVYGNGDDYHVGTFTRTTPLNPGASYLGSLSGTVPGGASGTFHIIVKTDRDGVVHQDPNTQSDIFISEPVTIYGSHFVDLTVPEVTLTPDVAPTGSSINVTYVTTNLPHASTSASGVWVDNVKLLDHAGTVVRSVNVAAGHTLSPGSSYTKSISFGIPAGLTPGPYEIRVRVHTDYRLPENGLTGNNALNAPIDIVSALQPDLAFGASSHDSAATEGEVFHLDFAINNHDEPFTGPVTLNVAFSDDDVIGDDILISSQSLDLNLATGASSSHSLAIPFPDGLSGSSYYPVISLDPGNLIYESNETNNQRITLAIPLNHRLRLTPAEAVVYEDRDPATVAVELQRGGSIDNAMTVNLSIGAGYTDQLTIPSTVTIPAGQAGVAFYADITSGDGPDGDQPVPLIASAIHMVDAETIITVMDVESPALTVTGPATLAEGASGSFQVNLGTTYAEDTYVSLMADPDGVMVPVGGLTVPAGSSLLNFSLTAEDDGFPRLDQDVSLTFSHPHFQSVTHMLTVLDDDMPMVDLILDLAEVNEAAPAGHLTGSVNVTIAPLEDLSFRIDGGLDLAPKWVTLAAGTTSAAFNLDTIDNSLSDGNRMVSVDAMLLDGVTGQDITIGDSHVLTILDDEAPSLFLSLDRDTAPENTPGAAIATLTRNHNLGGLTVTLSGSAADVAMPAQVVFSAGQSLLNFTVDTLDDGVSDGDEMVELTASATGFNQGSATLLISDRNVADLAPSNLVLPLSAPLDETVTVSYEVANQGSVNAPGFTETLWLSQDPFPGNDVIIAQTSGAALAAGVSELRDQQVHMDATAGEWYVILTLDDADLIDELSEINNSVVSAAPITLTVPYSANVTAPFTSAAHGHPVTLSGTVTDTTGSPAANAQVSVYVRVKGSERVLTAFSDPSGNFTAFFYPLPFEAGRYTIAAAHPAAASPADQDTFDLVGLRANSNQLHHRVTAAGAAVDLSTQIRNLADVSAGGLSLTQLDTPAGFTVNSASLSSSSIAADGSIELNYQIDPSGSGAVTETVRFRISDGGDLDLIVPVTFQIVPQAPVIVLEPTALNTAVLRGGSKTVTVTVSNQGGAASGDLELFLPQVDWLSTATPMPFSLDVDESLELTLVLTPDETVAIGPYSGNMVVNGAAIASQSLPYDINVISDGIGDLQILAVDEAYYFDPAQPALAGAHVVVRDPLTLEDLHTATTDASGVASFVGLTEGYYQIEVHKPNHAVWRHTVLVDAGTTNDRTAFLGFQAVTYTWNVYEDIIEDRYIINIGTTFETVVPKPVVTVEPNLIDLYSLDEAGDTLDVNFRVTNQGLIAANQSVLSFGDHPDFTVDVLSQELGDIGAGESRFVPVRFTRLNPIASKTTTTICQIPGGVRYRYNCDGEITNETPIPTYTGECGPSDPDSHPAGGDFEGGPHEEDENGTGHVFGGGESDLPPLGCDCTEFNLACKDFSPLFKPPAKALEEYLEAQLAEVIDFKVTPKCKATLEVCCDEDGNSGLSGNASASLTIAAKPRTDLEVSVTDTIDLGTGTLAVTGKIWAGLLVEPYITAAGFVDIDCDGNLDYGMSATAGMNLRVGVQGTLSGTITPITGVPYKAEVLVQGIVAAHASCTVSYSKSAGLSTCSTSDGLYANLSAKWPGGTAGLWDGENYYIIDPHTNCGSKNEASLEAALDEAFNRALALSPGAVPSDAELQAIVNDWMTGNLEDMMAKSRTIKTNLPVMDLKPIAADPAGDMVADGVAKLSEGVCARVKLNIDQNTVLARSVFRANLDLINQDTSQNVDEILMNIFVTDADGQPADAVFEIREPALTNITAVDGTGVIAPGQAGNISWTLIPSEDAAPTEPVTYYIGGTLIYHQPVTGNSRVIPLDPAPIVVKPTPALHVRYFHQRDVYADDPFTAEIEPSEPFSLGMIVENRGAGTAYGLQITSGQPQIVENEKGLAIGFEIIGSQIDGTPASPSLTADFGDVEPGERRVGQWLMTSTLHGHFIDYQADFRQKSGLGEAFSQLKSVDIHETNRVVNVGGDGLPDFLVNDILDVDDTPDTLYQSNGTIQPVTAVTIDSSSISGNLVTISGIAGADWTYIHGDDAFAGSKILDQVLRADGSVVSTDNFWTTDRTFIGQSLPPVYEQRVHILDHNPSASYTLHYVDRPADSTAPSSSVDPLPTDSPANFLVTWTGTDNLLGDLIYDIYAAVDGGPYEPWLSGTSLDGAVFTGVSGSLYQFFSVARDAAGNYEAAPALADASTTTSLVNHAPVISAPASLTIDEGETLTLTLTASDVDGDPLTFALTAGPSGAQLNGAGYLSWPTGELHGGASYTFNLEVRDNGIPALMDTAVLTVNVNEHNLAPRLLALPIQNGDDASALSFSIPAVDDDQPAQSLTYTLDAAPVGMTLSAATGLISWANPTAGDHIIGVTVTDNGSPVLSASRDYGIHINHINAAPIVIGSVADQTFEIGDFNLNLNPVALFSDPEGETLILSASLAGGAALPAWLSFDPAAAAFSGSATTPGTWTIQLNAADPHGESVALSFNLTISQLTRIIGSRWWDNNGDGIRDAGEAPVRNRNVYLDYNQNGSQDSGEPHMLTQADGSFSFDVTPGDYTIRETASPGTNHVPASHQTHTLELSNSADVAWVVSADFNNDGRQDLAAQLVGDGLIWIGLAQANTQPFWFSYVSNSAVHALAHDINGDGYADLVIADEPAGQILFHSNDRSGGLDAGRTIVSGVDVDKLVLTDWNGDQLMDVLGADLRRGEIVITENVSGRLRYHSTSRLAQPLLDLAAGRFVGAKAFYDLVVIQEDGNTYVHPDFNQPFIGRHILVPELTDAESLAVHDLDRDGLDDLIGSVQRYRDVRILAGNGSGFDAAVNLHGVFQPGPLSLVDLDDNGFVDIITSDNVVPEAYIMLNAGFGNFRPTRLMDLDSPAHSFVGMELDRDGDTDLIAAGQGLPYYHSNWITRVSVAAGSTVENHRGVVVEAAGFEGRLYLDQNRNGVRDAGEIDLDGWRVFIDHNGNGVWNSGEPQTTTACGSYSLGPVESDGYLLTVEAPRGWSAVNPVGGTAYHEPEDGEIIVQDFGFIPVGIVVTAPAPGSVLTRGSVATISWSTAETSRAQQDTVRIELSNNGGESWLTLFDQTPNDGSQAWEVDADESEKNLIRITSNADSEVWGVSDDYFTIKDNQPVRVLSPNGGEILNLGDTKELAWVIEHKSEAVAIEISHDKGKSWDSLFKEVANTGSIAWKVAGKTSALALIRVTDLQTGASDQSDAVFTIRNPFDR